MHAEAEVRTKLACSPVSGDKSTSLASSHSRADAGRVCSDMRDSSMSVTGGKRCPHLLHTPTLSSSTATTASISHPHGSSCLPVGADPVASVVGS